jgi:diguanylate cyclase (GGDEF)-like protein
MQSSSNDRLAAALFRLLAARRGPRAAGIFTLTPAGARMVAGTPELRALGADPAQELGPVRLFGRAARIDPGALGLACPFAVAAPVAAAGREAASGFLLVADRRPRRLTGALARLLADAAALAGPIMIREGTPASPVSTPRAASRPRSAAQRMVEAAMRPRRAGMPSLMLVDLDRFRAVNETLGHAAGDALLAVTGARLEQALGPGDRLVRLEGDRFAVVAQPGPAALPALAEHLLRAVSQPFAIEGRSIVTQASIGGIVGAAEIPVHELLTRAESALRRAKAEGRNRFVLHEPAEAGAALERSRLEFDLAHAVGNGQMHLAFQPYVDLRDGHVSGVEALLRWRHPTRGELAPSSFISIAEATGLILPIGRWALRAALARGVAWPERLGLSVNISPLQFQQPGFLREVDEALAATGFPAARLELEITETVLMRDNPETTAQLQALIARGIRIALDDFGTGYSALAYLARLPHHRIKLDKAFVQDLGNPTTAELIRAINGLARAQRIAVTAEGVERPEHLAMVRRAGFTHAQGYAIGAPVADPLTILAETVPVAAG